MDATTGSAEIREAALRPLARTGRGFWALAALLAAAVAAALAAWTVQLRDGLQVAGYGDRAFWGVYEANLVAFIGVSYGGALVSAILRLTGARWRAPVTRIAEATALFALLIGMTFALIHLGRPERFWMIITRAQVGSPIVWDLAAIMTYLATTVIFLYLPLVPDLAVLRDRARGVRRRIYGMLALGWVGTAEQHRALDRAVTAVAVLIIPIAVLVHSVLSWAFAVTGRPGWYSTIFAPYFVVAALYSGLALVVLVVAAFRRAYRLEAFIGVTHFQRLAYILVALDLTYLYLTFTEILTEGYVQTHEAAKHIDAVLVGPFAPMFWLFVVLGGLLPLLIIAFPRTRTVKGIVAASAMIVAALWLKRLLIVLPAVTHPLIAGTWGSFPVTWVAAAITLGAVAAIPLLLMLFFKIAPILAVGEMETLVETAPEARP